MEAEITKLKRQKAALNQRHDNNAYKLKLAIQKKIDALESDKTILK